MKFNWGTGIVLSFIVFTIAILAIIIFPFSQRVDLVTDEYYQEEIKYQEQIDKLERSAMLSETIAINQSSGKVTIKFPSSYKDISGEIFFYRPADARKDFSVPISADSAGSQSIDTSSLPPGLWRVKVLWSMNNLKYYYEKSLMI